MSGSRWLASASRSGSRPRRAWIRTGPISNAVEFVTPHGTAFRASATSRSVSPQFLEPGAHSMAVGVRSGLVPGRFGPPARISSISACVLALYLYFVFPAHAGLACRRSEPPPVRAFALAALRVGTGVFVAEAPSRLLGPARARALLGTGRFGSPCV